MGATQTLCAARRVGKIREGREQRLLGRGHGFGAADIRGGVTRVTSRGSKMT
jgi:hypothetical protein